MIFQTLCIENIIQVRAQNKMEKSAQRKHDKTPDTQLLGYTT